ncbi:MAG: hypothetical protein KF824_06005 [Fimbriimonadaceae bacterium]|nr:MAG: hypothetical protein KF824_06005 [Fimbriimonadaceae bacterium]
MRIKKSLIIIGALLSACANAQLPDPVCPVLGKPITSESLSVEYAGLKVSFCCAGCDQEFLASPTKFLKQAEAEHKVVALSLFDPVSKLRITPEQTKAVVDVAGIRYSFASQESADEFAEFPGLYTTAPTRESLRCPVMMNDIPTYSAAAGYEDFQGVRYYFCCSGCDKSFSESPEKYAAQVKDQVRDVSSRKSSAPTHTMAPTCAGCAGEARLLSNGEFPAKFMLNYRFIAINDPKSRHRFSLDYAVSPRLTIGLERSGTDDNPNPTGEFSDNPTDWLRFSDGDALILPRFSWFATPEGKDHPSVMVGMASDRLSTPTGQAFFATFSKSIPGSQFTPFVSVKTNTTDGRTVFPYGVNFALKNDMVLQAINDGDYTHLLFTKMTNRAAYSLILARTRYVGFSVTVGF